MWVFYLISLPLTMGMVIFTLRYFAGPDVPRHILFTVAYTWFCSLSFIILVPADIWTAMIDHNLMPIMCLINVKEFLLIGKLGFLIFVKLIGDLGKNT